jgi:hypothetical protein
MEPPISVMGFLDKLRGKKVETSTEKQSTSETSPSSSSNAPQRKRVKKYTSEGKPIYE